MILINVEWQTAAVAKTFRRQCKSPLRPQRSCIYSWRSVNNTRSYSSPDNISWSCLLQWSQRRRWLVVFLGVLRFDLVGCCGHRSDVDLLAATLVDQMSLLLPSAWYWHWHWHSRSHIRCWRIPWPAELVQPYLLLLPSWRWVYKICHFRRTTVRIALKWASEYRHTTSSDNSSITSIQLANCRAREIVGFRRELSNFTMCSDFYTCSPIF